MKIALISPNYLPIAGGTQVALHNIAKNLVWAGHDVVVLTRRSAEDEEIDRYDEIVVRSFQERGGKLSFVCTNITLYAFLQKHIAEVDIIHQFHLLRFGLPVVIFGKRHRKPVITTLMGTDTFDPENTITKIFAPYLAYIMNSSAAMTSPSVDLARYAYDQGCVQRIHIIPHGIGVERFMIGEQHAARSREAVFPNARGKKIILSVGRLHSIKKPDILVRAMSILVDTYGVRNAVLLIVGTGPEEVNLRRMAQDLKLGDYVEFRGHVPQETIADYYHCCDIFAFHSTYETFGIVLAEAMACGKPVVSTLAGAIPEIVDPEATGILVPPNDPEAFAKALKMLIIDEQLSARMGDLGREKVSLHYNWSAICQKYLALYRDVLKY